MLFKQKLAYIALMGLLIGAFLLLPNTLIETATAAQVVHIGTAAPDVIVVVVETGPGEETPTQEPEAWRVDSVPAITVGRWSYPWYEGLCEDWWNAIYPITMRHHFYIQGNAPLVNNQIYSITTPFGMETLAFHDHITRCESIKVNQVGYYGRSTIRYANLGVYLGDLGPRLLEPLPHYEVVDENSGKVVLSGQAVYWGDDTAIESASGEHVYRLDLAALPDGGPYYISVLGFGRSNSFGVGAEYSKQLAYVHTRGLYHQRCGIALEEPYTIFTRGECHTTVEVTDAEPPGFITERGPVMKIRGGYHDAGDFDRRLSHTLIPAWMLNLYEAFPERFFDNQFNLPESGNEIPDWLDEALWGILVWEYLQDEDGGVRAGTETDRDVIYGEVNAETDALVYRTYRKDGHATASAAGLFAHAARLVAPFDSSRATELLARAIKAWNYVQNHNLPTAHAAQKMYAALQLYLATGDAAYHDAFRANANQLLSNMEGHWPETYHPFYFNLGTIQDGMIFAPYFFAYLLTDKAVDTSVRDQFIALLRAKADEIINDLNHKPYPMGPAPGLGWGTATNQGRYAEPVMLMYRLTGEQNYLDAASQLADYAIGLNPIGKVYVTGIGATPPNNPCHLDSYFTWQRGIGNVPGIVVYGPMVELSSVGYQFVVWSKVYPAWKELPHQRRYCEGWSLIPVNEFGTYETIVLNACLHAFLNDTSSAFPGKVPEKPLATFHLAVPKGIGLIHVPLKVTEVDGKSMGLKTIGDFYDALGGVDNVNLIVTYQPPQGNTPGAWQSYLGKGSRGTAADQKITDELGIITLIKTPVTLRLKGDALGTDGVSQIKLNPGINLIGVPLRNNSLKRVSDLLSLEGIKDNATAIIIYDGGKFKAVARAGYAGDIPLTGGQAFIISARAAGVAGITGVAWDNVSGGPLAAPPMTVVSHKVDEETPVLAVHGGVVDEVTGVAKEGFRITVKNLSTGVSFSTLSGSDNPAGGYSVTFVELAKSYATRVGDILEITVETPSSFIGIQPLRHIVSTDDVNNCQIQLPNLIAYEIPKETKLLPNYPNPFNPETWIPYQLSRSAEVSIRLYDAQGRLVRTLDLGERTAGFYLGRNRAAYWDGLNSAGEKVASGIYFYQLNVGDFKAMRKMVIVK